MATIHPYPAAFSPPFHNLSRGKHSAVICQSITDTALLQTAKPSHLNLKTSIPRRDLTFKLLGSFALSRSAFPLVDSSLAYGFLEADDNEELLEKVKADRKKRLQKREETNKLKSEAEMEFDYSGARGPSHWGDLKEEWKTCGHGRHQSPIDIVERNVEIYPNLGKLHKSYKAANASLKNRGHDIMVRWAEGAGTIHVDGSNFTLLQCHWHSPAEHTINGRRYPLKIHMVHQTEDNRTVVIAILYEYGRHDPFLSELMDQISDLSHHMEAGAEETLGIIDPKHIKLGSRKYYRYTGSLTTPPCTEGVIWIIVDKVRTVSRDQVRKLVMAVHDVGPSSTMPSGSTVVYRGLGKNSRPTQLENGRVVELYTPRHGISKHI